MLNRADIQKISSDPKIIRALEDLFQAVADGQLAIGAQVAATQGITNATVVTLSANDAFTNERVLEAVSPLALSDTGPGGAIVIGFVSPVTINGGYPLEINLLADTSVTLPTSGTLLAQESFASLGNYANDAAAATGGVAIGGLYRAGSALMVRVS